MKKRKLLAVVLVFVMTLSLLPTAALANEPTEALSATETSTVTLQVNPAVTYVDGTAPARAENAIYK